MLRFERYRRTRFWAVYEFDTLICLTVYKRGAKALINFWTTGSTTEGPFADLTPPRRNSSERTLRTTPAPGCRKQQQLPLHL